jgi:sialate O-acetylesterase
MHWTIWAAGLVFASLSTLPGTAQGQLRLATLFSDHMVLQRERPITVWGWAEQNRQVTVVLQEQRLTATADEDGRWQVVLEPMPAGGPYEMSISDGDEQVTFRDLLVGEVWICSGQSNMQWTVAQSADAESEIAAGDYPGIRLIHVPPRPMNQPQETFEGQWVVATPQTVGQFTAVGYYFGRELHRELGVPVGLINTSRGGTPAEAWTSRPALEAESSLRPLLERWDTSVVRWQAEHGEASQRWEQAAGEARENRQPPPERPTIPENPAVSQHRPANLFNGMIAPLIPYAIRGAIWYQGESNASRAQQYRELFPVMVHDWRNRWQQGDFSFYFVQLANFRAPSELPVESEWAELREAQTMALRRLPNTGMAVTIDIGEAGDIHPRNKQDVGRRLARLALANDYGMVIVPSGPLYRSHEIRAGEIILHFDHPGGGLVAQGRELEGFTIAGADRKFVHANARIDGTRVIVWNDAIHSPAAVRYAWADNPACNLYNAEGLPASPFRTDAWPMMTAGRH